MKVLYLLVLLCLYVRGDNSCDGGNIVEFLDDVLVKVKSELPDPLPLPSKEGESEHGVTLTEGIAWGIDTLKRTGPAEVVCGEDAVTIKAVLGVEEMSGRYKWEKYIGGIFTGKRRAGIVFIKAKKFEIEVVVKQEYREDANASLESLVVKEMSGIDIEITGWNYVTWVLSHIMNPVVNLFKHTIMNFVEETLKEAVARQIAEIRIPVNPKSTN